MITITLNGVQDDHGDLLDNATASYGKLIGDVNADGVVDFTDIGAVRAGRSQRTSAGNFRLDVNADGGVNGPDYGIVKASRRHALP